MNKEELYIITDESKVQLDLPSPSGITLKWVSNLFNDISKLTCSYSYTFKLPITSNNRRALKLADDIRHDNSMMKKVYRAEFYINGICLCPNANLYISETTDSFSCVMTWKVLKAFEALKSDSCKINELPSLGKIVWGGEEEYGGTNPATSNMDSVVYPDYDAGVPHMTNTPPKPCVPVYRIIQMINDKFDVKFNIGKLLENGMGMKPKRYLNNANYYGYRVYDDYISNGVIPIVNSEVNNDKYTIRGLYSISSHAIYYKYLDFVEKWQMAVFGTGSSSNPLRTNFYKVLEGTYTSLSPVVSDQLNATYKTPDVIAIGIPVLSSFKGNDFIKPMFAFQHDTGLFFFNAKKNQKESVDWQINNPYGDKTLRWRTRTYEGIEQIVDEYGTTKPKSWGNIYSVKCTEDTTGVNVYSMDQGVDGGKEIGIIGFFTRNAFSLKGSCELRISKSAVSEGRVNVYKYMWICLAAVYVSKKDDSKEYDFKIEPVTEKSINSAAGFQSTDTPKFDSDLNVYVCNFEFGSEYDVRKIEVDSNEDKDFKGYVLLPYFPEDHIIDVEISDEDGNTDTVQKLNLKEGDFTIENLVFSEIVPSVSASVLPASLRIVESLPQISCFDFIKSVFYMNGAMPRVERDGHTITAMYYNQLRDRVNDGDVIDWSDKMLSADKDLAKSYQYHSTKFAKNNYFEMSKSSKGKTDEEILEEFDQYGIGYGKISIDDDMLKDETSVFRSSFYPAFVQNLRYPLIKVGNTCKIWEGDNVLESKVPGIYGYMVYRTLDNRFENTSVRRPQNADITMMHKRMNIFSPFDDSEMMDEFFGYLKEILNDYQLVKEQMNLNEIDLRDFDESMPVYLRKYNAYFAVSSIQRDRNGVSTVEFVKLPRVYDDIKTIDNTYSYEILSSGYIEVQNTYSSDTYKMYFKRTKESTWEELTNRIVNFGEKGIYAIAAEYENNGKSSPAEMRVYCKYYGKYRFTYRDIDTGEERSIVRSEALAYFDGNKWEEKEKDFLGNSVDYHSIKQDDKGWHYVEITIPIRNQFNEIVEAKKWTSPILVSGRSAIDEYDANGNRTVISEGNIGRLYVNLIRNYTSNQTAIVSSRRMEDYDGFCDVDTNSPIWAYPYEGTKLKGDSYTLRIYVYNTLEYTVSRYKNGVLQSSNKLKVKLRTYYDDERMVETTEKTYMKSEFGQYHTIKYEGDLVDENGTVIKKIRRRVIWFVSEKIQSVIDSPYGKEHDDDASVKVNNVVFGGTASIVDRKEHAYTMQYEPSYADIGVERTTVSVSDEDSQYIDIISQSTDGFTIKAKSLPVEEKNVKITVDVRLADGSVFRATKDIFVVKPNLSIRPNGSNNVDIEALNGSGSKKYIVSVLPGNYYPTVKSITSSNSHIEVLMGTLGHFTLTANDVSADEQAVITVVGEYNGETMTSDITVKLLYKETWSTDYLDNAQALIVDRNGTFYTRSEWEKSGIINEDADGIAVSDGTHRFVIAKKDCAKNYESGYWSTVYSSKMIQVTETSWREEETGLLISGIKTTKDKEDAITDFLGKTNTDKIILQDPTPSGRYTSSAAELTRKEGLFPSGKEGYLGALGEWNFVLSIRGKIDELLKSIGGTAFGLGPSYWTSTQVNDARAWKIYVHNGNMIIETLNKNQSTWQEVRAFGELTVRTDAIKRGSFSILGPDSFNVINGKGSQKYVIQYNPTDASVKELAITSDNPDVSVRQISNTEFELSVNGSRVDEVANIVVKARVNGLIYTNSIKVTAKGETVIDFDKLAAAHVLIIDKEYNLYDEDEWIASKKLSGDAEGIAVSNGKHRFIMALKNASKEYWGGRGINIPGLSSNGQDYLGKENTKAIIAAVTRTDGYITTDNSAAEIASKFTFPSGEKGYLGSAGEWEIAGKYQAEIQALLDAIQAGTDDFILDYSFTYWSSTGGYDDARAVIVHCYISSSGGTNQFSFGTYARNYTKANIRAFRQF